MQTSLNALGAFELWKQLTSGAIDAKQRGLVPQSGDWQNPDRWVLPKEGAIRQEALSLLDTFKGTSARQADKIFGDQNQVRQIVDFLDILNQLPISDKTKAVIETAKKVIASDAAAKSKFQAMSNVRYFVKTDSKKKAWKQTEQASSLEQEDQKGVSSIEQPPPSKEELERLHSIDQTRKKLDQLSKGVIRKTVLTKASKLVPLNHLVGVADIQFMPLLMRPITNAAGIFNPQTGEIELYGMGQTPELVHEIGHAVHLSRYKRRFSLDLQLQIHKEYERAIESNTGFTSKYAKKNYKEFFAECYVAFLTKPERLKKRNSSMFTLLEQVFKEIE